MASHSGWLEQSRKGMQGEYQRRKCKQLQGVAGESPAFLLSETLL